MAVPLEKFVQQLEDSGILAGDTLKDFLPPKASPQSAEELALELVRSKKLTKFQAEEVSKGKGKSLVLGNYVLMERIGAGGMGQVFKAQHRVMERVVAVKLLPPTMTKDQAAIARFHREVKAAAKLRHPNIIAADDADQANGVHFLVMEYVDGSDLSALVKKNGAFPVEKAIDYILQAARGLEFAHKKGVVHRDIKPANLLLDSEGTVKILDMGLARIHGDKGQAELTSTGAVMGTVDYMAPEQALNTKTADARADIYSLGCSLYYLLTATATYDGDTLMAKLLAHRDQPIPSLRSVRSEVSEQLEAIFMKMVAKNIDDRFQTMTEVISALEGCNDRQANTTTQGTTGPGPVNRLRDKSISSAGRTMSGQTSTRASEKSRSPSARQSPGSLAGDVPADFIDELPPAGKSPRTKKSARPAPASTNWKNAILKDQKKLLMIGGGLLGIGLLFAVVIVTLQGSDTKLIVTVNEPDAIVEVLNAEGHVEVTRKGDTTPIKISIEPGKHQIMVQKDGFQIFSDHIEIKSGNTVSIKAELAPLGKLVVGSKPATLKPLYFETPAFQLWLKEVLAMPAEKQVDAVSKKLMELNPGFDGKVGEISGHLDFRGTPRIENGVVTELMFVTAKVTDISPLRVFSGLKVLYCAADYNGILSDISPLQGIRLTKLKLFGNRRLTDLSPLKDMPLDWLDIQATSVSDLTSLTGMPLEHLNLHSCDAIADLSPLKGMPLTDLRTTSHSITDLSPLQGLKLKTFQCGSPLITNFKPLQGMPLDRLAIGFTKFDDLSILKGMPLVDLDLIGCTNISDFSPLKEFPLKQVRFEFKSERDTDILRSIKTLEHINGKPVAEFWKEVEEQQKGKKLGFQMPGFDQWVKEVQAMPAEKQVEAVSKKLVELNPGFDGKVTDEEGKAPVIENGVVTRLGFVTDHVTDISPVRSLSSLSYLSCSGSGPEKGQLSDLSPLKGMFLGSLYFANTKVSDLSPLRGMPIWRLICVGTPVADLSQLQGMPLTNLGIGQTKISDLSVLKGMSLGFLSCENTLISDISPLRGMPLGSVFLSQTKIADLSPLSGSGMTLKWVSISETPVSDLSPLEGMKLNRLVLTPKNITKGIEVIRNMKTIERLGTRNWAEFPPDEFWKKYDAGEFGKPTAPDKSITDFNSPAFKQWLKDVQALPAEKQIEAVSKKLMELNPGFDGKVTNIYGKESPDITNGNVTGLSLVSDNITDISPLRALTEIKSLKLDASGPQKSKLWDLSPLQGLQLTWVSFVDTNVADLEPLLGMNLEVIVFFNTKVSSLAPLRGMVLKVVRFGGPVTVSDLSPLSESPLTWLDCESPTISDLSPLSGKRLMHIGLQGTRVADFKVLSDMPLKDFYFGIDARKAEHRELVNILRSIKTLEVIDYKPAAEFWKKYDAGEFGKPQ